MPQHADAAFVVKSWDEQPYDEQEGLPRLTSAHVTKAFTGDIEGEGTLEYLMVYRSDGSATFVGIERIIGRLGKRSGSFVLEHRGTFEAGAARATCTVITGSGTGELASVRGEGRYMATESKPTPFTLDYSVD